MSVVARFVVSSVEQFPSCSKINFGAVYTADEKDPHYEEIKAFHSATPSGTLSMTTDNPAAAEQFIPGDHYYLQLERVAGRS